MSQTNVDSSSPDGAQPTSRTSFLSFFSCRICSKTEKSSSNEPKKPKMKKNKTVKGTIKFEKATNIELWRNILDNSIIGTKLVERGVICSKSSGAIIACNPADFTPSVEQIEVIKMGFENIDLLKQNGFMVVNDVFEPFDGSENEICARIKGTDVFDEMMIVATDTKILIGITPNPVDQIKDLLKDIRQMLINQGF